MDQGLPLQRGLARGQRLRPRRPVDANRRQRAARVAAAAPRIQEQAGQVTGVVGMQVRQEDSLQPGEVESRARNGRRRAAPAVNDEDARAHDQR